MAEQIVRTVCPHDCPDQCSMLAHVDGGRLVRVEGDPDHLFTRGFLCAKVNLYPQRVHSPERLLYPLRRTGPKGKGRFERICWDEALDAIAAKWRAVEPDAILGYAYSGTMGIVNKNLPQALFAALGARPVAVGTVCDTASEAGWSYAVGECPGPDPESVSQSDLIIAWGANLVTTNVHMIPFVDDACARGARLIVIDPYATRTARRADWHIPIRIGTDAALALGIMHVLERDGLVDEDSVRTEATGWERMRAEVLPQYSPDTVAGITGMEAAEIERLAHLYGKAKAPFIRLGLGMSRNSHGGMAVRTVALLPAVVGAWAKPGGGALTATGGAFRLDISAVRRPDLRRNPREVNHALLGRELVDPTLRALFVMANNPAVTCPEQDKVMEGLRREDLFTVVHDLQLTDTARYADIVLPACTALEDEDLYRSYGHRYFQFGPKVLDPLGESRPNRWVVSELARRMGLDDPVFSRGMAEHVQALLAPLPEFQAEQVMAGGPFKVEVESGVPHTHFFSQVMAEAGLPPLPEWKPDPVEAEEGARYPLRLLTAPGHYQSHSAFAGVAALQRSEGEPHCLLHPIDAEARGIGHGDPVELYNDRGSLGLLAHVTERAQQGVVVVEGQRGHDRYAGGGSINVLTSGRLTDMGGGATYQSTWLEIRKR